LLKLKGLVVLVFSALLLTSSLLIDKAFANPEVMFVNPPITIVPICSIFEVDIDIRDVENLYGFEFWLGYDTTLLDAIDVFIGNFLNPPNIVFAEEINDPLGYVHVGVVSVPPAPPANGEGTLATIVFHCTGTGISPLHLYDTLLANYNGELIPHETEDGYVTQDPETLYVKPPYPDYAPSGMPDFDQRQWGNYIWQDQWGAWSHCGPVSVANSLWYLDSRYDYIANPFSQPPPTISDSFPLVQAYGPWDDHDPQNVPWLVEHLAFLMDCDGRRTGLFTGVFWSGTYVWDMQAGLAQYLSWSGVNPLGDVDGNGVVNMNDATIVMNAFGSHPGDPHWNTCADVYPATLAYPPITDNVIDVQDVNLVNAHFGQTGLFYEHTEDAFCRPDFFELIEREVERCQDVVLLLGFYYMGEFREGGHYVTVAGVDSANMELLISNPIRDDFEAGRTPGRSPVPHIHQPPEPPFVTHNDAAFVSQDAYPMAFIPGHPSGYHWRLDRYFDDPAWEAIIEYAVITSPLSSPDIAITNIATCKDGCLPRPVVHQGYTAHIYVTVENQGNFVITSTVNVYAGFMCIGSQVFNNLAPGAHVTLTFVWNTATFALGDYAISAIINPLPGEEDLADNTLPDGILRVVIPGDIDGNGHVQLVDLVTIAIAYGSIQGDPNYNPNADITDDHWISLVDLVILAIHYGQ